MINWQGCQFNTDFTGTSQPGHVISANRILTLDVEF